MITGVRSRYRWLERTATPNEPGGGRSMKCNEEKAKQLEKLVERDEESQVWLPQKKMDDPVPPKK